MNKYVMLIMLFCSLLVRPAMAAEAPQSLALDSRIKEFTYSEGQVYILKSHHLYATYIEFNKDESIVHIGTGDKLAWTTKKILDNRLSIKPRLKSSRTNLVVITTKRTYNFDLRTAPSTEKETLSYFIKFSYPDDEAIASKKSRIEKRRLESQKITPAKKPWEYNFDYTIKLKNKKTDIMPSKIFDDGRFTYLEFGDNASVPSAYIVDAEGKETLVNTTYKHGYLIVHSVTRQISLRVGGQVVCVYNERKEKQKSSVNKVVGKNDSRSYRGEKGYQVKPLKL